MGIGRTLELEEATGRSRFRLEDDAKLDGDVGTAVGVFRCTEDGDRAEILVFGGIEVYGCQRGFGRAAGGPRWAMI